jgi:hypothetical protein
MEKPPAVFGGFSVSVSLDPGFAAAGSGKSENFSWAEASLSSSRPGRLEN